MKKPLVKVSDDVLQGNPARKGKYFDENNVPLHGIYIRKHKNIEERLFINTGILVRIYKYPIIDRTFQSPLVNDHNLNLGGGWGWPGKKESECLTRVMSGKKPIGFYHFKDDESITEYCESGFPYVILKDTDLGTNTLGLSIKGTFSENFDMDALINDYYQYLKKSVKEFELLKYITEIIGEELEFVKNHNVSDFLNFDYGNPNKSPEYDCLTGLILGYPIETTVSLILQDIANNSLNFTPWYMKPRARYRQLIS